MNPQESAQFLKMQIAERAELLRIANEVIEAFGCPLITISDDRRASAVALGVQFVERPQRITHSNPAVVLRWGTGRETEALAHELLHCYIAAIGYPKLCQNTVPEEQLRFINALVNVAEHRIMKPLFVGLGFDEGKFLSTNEMPDNFRQHVDAIEALAPFESPANYLKSLRDYLRSYGLKCGVWGSFNSREWVEAKEMRSG